MKGIRADTLFLVAVVTVLAAALNHFAPFLHWDRGMYVLVRDETGKPIQGVVVAAVWEPTGGLESSVRDAIHVDEAITDAAGVATIGRWGPKLGFRGKLGIDQPHVQLLKLGYAPIDIQSGEYADRRLDPRRRLVTMKPIDTVNRDVYEAHVKSAIFTLARVYASPRCHSLRLPRTVMTLESMYAPIRPPDVTGAPTAFNELGRQVKCGAYHWQREKGR